MKRLERLTAMLSLLQSRNYTGLTEMVNRFKVSERTIFRDLKALHAAGVPLYFEDQKGYSIIGRHFLSPLSFTLDEAKSFIFVNQLAKKYMDAETYGHFSTALEKIRIKFRDHHLEDFEDLEGRVAAYINKEYPSGRLNSIEQACSRRHVLHIKYRSIRGQETERLIEPIGITFYSQSWHVIAYCRLREDYRDFSLTRISHLKDTGEIMTTRRLTLDAYIKKIQSDQQD